MKKLILSTLFGAALVAGGCLQLSPLAQGGATNDGSSAGGSAALVVEPTVPQKSISSERPAFTMSYHTDGSAPTMVPLTVVNYSPDPGSPENVRAVGIDVRKDGKTYSMPRFDYLYVELTGTEITSLKLKELGYALWFPSPGKVYAKHYYAGYYPEKGQYGKDMGNYNWGETNYVVPIECESSAWVYYGATTGTQAAVSCTNAQSWCQSNAKTPVSQTGVNATYSSGNCSLVKNLQTSACNAC